MPLCEMPSKFFCQVDPIADTSSHCLGWIALVRTDNLPVYQLFVGIGREDDASSIRDRKSREPRVSTKLTAPVAAHDVGAARDIIVGGTGRWAAGDAV